MRIVFTATALNDIERLPRDIQRRIIAKLERACADDDALATAKPLAGYHGFFRYRVGPYRVIVQPSGHTITVHLVDKRDSAYRDL